MFNPGRTSNVFKFIFQQDIVHVRVVSFTVQRIVYCRHFTSFLRLFSTNDSFSLTTIFKFIKKQNFPPQSMVTNFCRFAQVATLRKSASKYYHLIASAKNFFKNI